MFNRAVSTADSSTQAEILCGPTHEYSPCEITIRLYIAGCHLAIMLYADVPHMQPDMQIPALFQPENTEAGELQFRSNFVVCHYLMPLLYIATYAS